MLQQYYNNNIIRDCIYHYLQHLCYRKCDFIYWNIVAEKDAIVIVENLDEKKEVSTGRTKCFTCGKLGVEECDLFDAEDDTQIKDCSQNEVCLLYTWKKSSRGAIGIQKF